jgi:hypothetical protein
MPRAIIDDGRRFTTALFRGSSNTSPLMQIDHQLFQFQASRSG